MSEGQIQTPVLINASQYDRLRDIAKRKGISFSAQVREALDYYLHNMEGE